MNVEPEHDGRKEPTPTELFAACLDQVTATWRQSQADGRPMTEPNLMRFFQRSWSRSLKQARINDDERLREAGLASARRYCLELCNTSGCYPIFEGEEKEPAHATIQDHW